MTAATAPPTKPPTMPPTSTRLPEIRGTMHSRFDEILTPDALEFIGKLDGAFSGRRAELLEARRERGQRISHDEDLQFLPATAPIRDDASWRVADPAPGLERRWVEITGPPTPKMTVNALNSGADVWMADLEDATAPSWRNIVDGQIMLYDAIRDQADFTDENGKEYRVGEQTPTIVLRPRGLRLCEKHLIIDSRPLPASLVDFGLYFFHNARRLIEGGAGPYFYLPKLESHLEARWWNDIFVFAQDALGIPRGTIRATVLVETLPAAFEMDEILYELREHSAGLNAGRWDYIFSYIKTFAQRGAEHVLGDRVDVTMTTPFLRAYTELLVKTCHRRGAHAIGGMAANVPDRRDPEASERALAKVRADKDREAADGFDGSWVAHPGLVSICREAFDAVLGDASHQIGRQRDDVAVTAWDLTDVHGDKAVITMHGVRTNISAAMRYLSKWIGGSGAVAIDGLMEDAATVEISRAQLWQWVANRVRLDTGETITRDMITSLVEAEADRLIDDGHWGTPEQVRGAADVLIEAALADGRMPGFFTPYAYVKYLTDNEVHMTGHLSKEDLRLSEHVSAR